jgi:hypothetical protein
VLGGARQYIGPKRADSDALVWRHLLDSLSASARPGRSPPLAMGQTGIVTTLLLPPF